LSKKVFITGELGMTALYLDKLFSQNNSGYEIVWGASNREISHCTFNSVYGNGNELDICNYQALEYDISMTRPDIIVHLAGIVGTDLCNRMPEQAVKSNVWGSYNIAKLSVKYNCKLVYFSTTAIYDPNAYHLGKPIREDTSKLPQTHYGITKYAGELISKSTAAKNLLVIRPCFVYGGKNDYHSALSKAVKSLHSGKNFDIFLDQVKSKDYLYVVDEIAAIKMLIDQDRTGDYNISFGNPRPFGEYVNLVEKELSGKVNFTYYPETDYLHDHIVDNAKIKSIGWKPKISLLEGIELLASEDDQI
jgi:UDP-glucose 4-epimerase